MSTKWYDFYAGIWESLVKCAKTVSEFGDYVYYGEKFPPDHYPSCYVCPMPILIHPATFMLSFNDVAFEFGIVTHHDDVKKGYLQAFELIGKIYDALVADRQLNGTVDKIEVTRIMPNWRGLGKGLETQWVGLQVIVTKLRT